ncbi:hypothetical protein O6H91_08G036700 [Diphasiastrum complanatum]|uniref:Uncharacterized protein n=1 Tax=Diphasiastrum complanatum TaxID=34168 RepID=A0ACC2CWU6_DIPCM|nr:hypothetical protein O6H91_08G036700 [Diphasiastrum complanatum]
MEGFNGADRRMMVTPEVVLDSLMKDGTFDSLRTKITTHLRNNEELKKFTSSMLEQSLVLNTPGAETKPKRELFEALRRELEVPVLERASRAAWEVMVSKDGIGKEIAETVDSVYYRLSGHDPPYASGLELNSSCQDKDSGVEDQSKPSDRGTSKVNPPFQSGSHMQAFGPKSSDDPQANGKQHIGVKRERESIDKLKIPQDIRAASIDGDSNGHHFHQKGYRT